MAKIIIENAIVERVFQSREGWGVGVYETFTRKSDQSEGRSRYTCWFKGDRPAMEEGQRVSLSGFVSTRVRSYEQDGETKYAVDVSVNGPRLISAPEDVPQQAEPASVDASTAWSAPAGETF